MKKYLRYLRRILHMSLIQLLIYPGDFFWSIFMMPIRILVSVLSIYFVLAVSTQHTLAGLSIYHLLFVGSSTSLIWYMSTFTPLGVGRIGSQIISGKLDGYLLKALPPFICIIFQDIFIHRIIQILIHLLMLTVIIIVGHIHFNLWQIFQILFVSLSSSILLHSIFLLGDALYFWFPNHNFSDFFLAHADNFARYPASIYPNPLRFFFIFILPAFLIGNPLYEVIQNTYTLPLFFTTIILMIFWLVLAIVAWSSGIKIYESAN